MKKMRYSKRYILDEILEELSKAEKEHPDWPDDIIHGVSIMNEESGEAIRAALNYVYESGDILFVKHELIQTAAMAIRNLLNMED